MAHGNDPGPFGPFFRTRSKQNVSIFVGNLPFRAEQEDVTELFAQFGEVVNCALPLNGIQAASADLLLSKCPTMRLKRLPSKAFRALS